MNTQPPPARVTIVVATYNRPDVLRVAIQSVLHQTLCDWRLLVLGDACDERTASVMQEFSQDARVSYINLPFRCGGQSLLNSAGMLLASTEYVALLNHDDVWLPDHLELAVAKLESENADFFVGRAAFARRLKEFPAGKPQPIFSHVSPPDRTLRQAYSRNYQMFEPASAWVIKKALIDRVGAWRTAASIYRVPLQDWVLRAWRHGAILASATQISCLKIETHSRATAGPKYASTVTGHEYLAELLAEHDAESMRASIQFDLVLGGGRRHFEKRPLASRKPLARLLGQILRIPWLAGIYLRTGWDAYSLICLVAGIRKGRLWQTSLMRRTGESLARTPTLDDVLEYLTNHQCREQS